MDIQIQAKLFEAMFPRKVFELGQILPNLTKLEEFLCQNH